MRRRYTEEEKAAGMVLAKEVGVTVAAQRLGLARTTLYRWLQDAKAAQARPEPQEAPAESQETPASQQPKRKVAKRYTPSQRAQILEYADKHGITAAHREYDVSRFTIRDWKRKVALAAAGKGDSPTSGPDPADIERQRDLEILNTWKLHPGLGPSQVRNQLRRKGVKVSVNTVRRVMEEAGYRPNKVRRHEHNQRYEAVRPNQLWHLDFVHRHINKANTFTLIMLDDYSRFVAGHAVSDAERVDVVIHAFEEAVARHGRPESVMNDRGSAFWSWQGAGRFTRLLTELGVDQLVARDKEVNGKVEVFNANLSKELFDAHRFYDLAEMKRRLETHLHWYNHRRTHHALGGLLVPSDRYHGRVEEVLARIEAGAGHELGDALALRNRALELFKVISVGGKPEVWLMGQRIMGT